MQGHLSQARRRASPAFYGARGAHDYLILMDLLAQLRKINWSDQIKASRLNYFMKHTQFVAIIDLLFLNNIFRSNLELSTNQYFFSESFIPVRIERGRFGDTTT